MAHNGFEVRKNERVSTNYKLQGIFIQLPDMYQRSFKVPQPHVWPDVRTILAAASVQSPFPLLCKYTHIMLSSYEQQPTRSQPTRKTLDCFSELLFWINVGRWQL